MTDIFYFNHNHIGSGPLINDKIISKESNVPDIPHLIKYICFLYDFSVKSIRCVIIRRRYLKSDAIFTENQLRF